MLPVVLITGFLGSGKTTLLNELLKQNHGLKIAVIENEFGEKNIDYEFVLHEKEQIYQMQNGCICCNVREDLLTALKEIWNLKTQGKTNFETVIIETTGLADPTPVLHTLKQDQFLAQHFYIDSIICLVDSVNFKTQIERSPEVKKQITAANIVLLNKIDLLKDHSQIEEVRDHILCLNPFAKIINTSHAKCEMGDVFLKKLFVESQKVNAGEFKFKTRVANHDPLVKSYYFEINEVINPFIFNFWLDLLMFQYAGDLYRMKGVLHLKDEPHKIFLQVVHDYIELNKGPLWEEHELRQSQIVIIGKSLDRSVFEAGFKSCTKAD